MTSGTSSTGKLVDLLDLKVGGNITHPQALVSANGTGWHRLLGEHTADNLHTTLINPPPVQSGSRSRTTFKRQVSRRTLGATTERRATVAEMRKHEQT